VHAAAGFARAHHVDVQARERAVLALQRGRQRRAAAHGVAHVGDGAARGFVLGQLEQDGQRAIQRLAGPEQRRQLLGELHEALAGERLGLEQRPPRRLAAALARQPCLDRKMALFLQAQHDVGIAGGFHLAVERLAAGVERLVAVQGHAIRRLR
jgi:hypothetical protein